jgi:hypothetical protein
MTNKIIFQKVSVILLLLCTASCNTTEPPDPPPGDIVYNTIILTVEWTDLYRIKIKWNKATSDTLTPFTYRLKQLDESGNHTTKDFIIVGNDTTYVIGEPDSLQQGARFWFKVEGYNAENKLKDTSQTITAQTLQPTSHNIVWTIDTLGQPGDLLYDVWGLDENNVYAVGGVHLPEGASIIIKWNGEKWLPFSPYPLTANSIFGFAANDIWVVGGVTFGYAAHWNGSVWEEYSFYPPPEDTVWGLRSVWGSSPDDVWAVGAQGTIIHWDGSEWEKIQSPTSMYLIDIYGTSSSNIYAVGATLTNEYELLHFDGNSWKLISNQIPISAMMFRSIWIDKSGSGFIVGNRGLHYNGSTWSLIPDNRFVRLQRVRGSGMNNVFAGGQYGNLLHYNGIEWTKYMDLEDLSNFSEMKGIAAFENSVIIVGYNFNGALVWHGRRNER